MTKYKEIPIDDSKGVAQFKVGDTVRHFSLFSHHDFKVKGIEKDIVVDSYNPTGVACGYKWQTCRKLEEVKPREFWVKPTRTDSGGTCLSYKPYEAHNFIHVREVIDD